MKLISWRAATRLAENAITQTRNVDLRSMALCLNQGDRAKLTLAFPRHRNVPIPMLDHTRLLGRMPKKLIQMARAKRARKGRLTGAQRPAEVGVARDVATGQGQSCRYFKVLKSEALDDK